MTIERVLLKIVFLNNSFRDKVDVFSSPVFSSILAALDLQPQEHVRYECGSKFPQHLRCTYTNEYDQPQFQYELFEFVHYYNAVASTTTTVIATTDDNNNDNDNYMAVIPTGIRRSKRCGTKRKRIAFNKTKNATSATIPVVATAITTTTTTDVTPKANKCGGHHPDTISSSTAGTEWANREAFKKEIAWCVVKNWTRLCQSGGGDTRLAFINSFGNVSNVILSQCDIFQVEDTFENLANDIEWMDGSSERGGGGGGDGVLGYMKMFSASNKGMYLKSINYRNIINLSKHIIMYFDVGRYYERNVEQIFRTPLSSQIDNLHSILSPSSQSSSNITSTDSGGTVTPIATNMYNGDDYNDNFYLSIFDDTLQQREQQQQQQQQTENDRLGYIESLLSSETFTEIGISCPSLLY